MQIEVTLNDFLYNAGLLGLIRIFQHADIPFDHNEGQKLSFNESSLESIEEHYFNLLIDRYGYDTSYNKMITSKDFIKHCSKEEIDEKTLEQFNLLIENMKRWLTSNSYKNTYPLIHGIDIPIETTARSLKKVTMKKSESISDITPQIQKMAAELLNCIKYLEHPEAKRYLVARVLIYTVIQGFWTNVSFLNSNASKKDPYQEFVNYFSKPLSNYLETKKDNKKYAKNKLSCATCNNKMGKLSESFDLTWLQKIGVDAARKSSYYWNHQKDLFICPVCNLVYSCVPLGFTLVKGKGLFINNNESVKQLVSSNEIILKDSESILTYDQLEEIAYYKILDVMLQSADEKKELEINNIQIIKFDKNFESRPYTFNILSKQRAGMIVDSKKSLNYLVGKFAKESGAYIQLYQEVLKRLYNGQTFYDLLFRLMKLLHSKEFNNGFAIYHILKITNNQFKGVNSYMSPKELEQVRIYGYWLRQAYRGSENKLGGILHRMLNALKVKNPNKFMETLIQAYSYRKKQIPGVFVQMLEDKKKFQTIGYAFLLGLEGYSGEQKDEQKEESNNE